MQHFDNITCDTLTCERFGDANRYKLVETFEQKPGLNADINKVYTEELTRFMNKNFEVIGTNATSAQSLHNANGGLQLVTKGADNDSTAIIPHLDTAASAWSSTNWGTEDQVNWRCLIRTGPEITNCAFWAGLKLSASSDGVYATDADQVKFLYSSDDDVGTLTTNANLHFVYSRPEDGVSVDYISDLGIVVAADTVYELDIKIDVDRVAHVSVGEHSHHESGTGLVTYSLAQSAVAGGTAVNAGDGSETLGSGSLPLTNDVSFIPTAGVRQLAGDPKSINILRMEISRSAVPS